MLLARLLFLLLFCLPPTVRGAGEFVPDPRTVQRCGPAYRYPQAGWIVLHIEGDPHERGVQHGRLLAPEIEDYVKCLAAFNGPKSPTESWKATRSMVDSLFLRGYTREQLEEMKGIAEGASAAGARYDGRKIDLLDIAALNSANEYDSLDNALANTPTGLEGMDIKPQGEIFVDGTARGKSPPLTSIQIAPGRHKIEIRRVGSSPLVLHVEAGPGEELSIRHAFVAPAPKSAWRRFFDQFK